MKIRYLPTGENYYSLNEFTYCSPRFGRSITVPAGFISDGATGAIDIPTDAWWVHDVICTRYAWDDGARISDLEASLVLFDLLLADGFFVRAPFWFLATFLFARLRRFSKQLKAFFDFSV